MYGERGDYGLGDGGANRLTLADGGLESLYILAAIGEGATFKRLERSTQNLTGVEVITLEFAILKRQTVNMYS